MENKKYNCIISIPIKANSQRVPKKNFKELGGRPLFEIMIDKALKSDADAVFVNTDSEAVKIKAKEMGAIVIDRPSFLSGDDINGNDLLLYDSKKVEAQIYIQLFVTAPFLKIETINKSIKLLKNKLSLDSVFTVNKLYSWFWFNGKPVNYNPSVLPRSQDATPIIKETTGLYAIRKKALEECRCRIGKNPFMLEIDEIEGKDIDTLIDFKEAENLIENSNFYSNNS